jgi:CheY-like chemotaxis protein
VPGRTARASATGEAALEPEGRLQPDLVLVDVQLPGISGIAVARRLATDRPRSVVILMSADAALLRTAAAVNSGAASTLHKPEPSPRTLRRCRCNTVPIGDEGTSRRARAARR